MLAPLHRDLGAHLWRGFEPWEAMASFMGRATGPTGGRDGTLHYGRLDLGIINPVSHIPDNYPVATGAAFAFKYREEDRVALAYCRDGSTSRGDFHEALNGPRRARQCAIAVKGAGFDDRGPVADRRP